MKKQTLFALLLAVLTAATLAAETRVLAFSGSTRSHSYNQKLIQEAAKIAEEMGAKITVINLRDYPMPFFDEDLEITEGMPKNAQRLRKLMIDHEVILIASPEYNHSVSAVLKNALDWASRGENGGGSREAFKGKNFGLMSASPGKKGGRRGLCHLREIIEDAGGTVISEQVCIPQAHKYFSDIERPHNPLLKNELQALLTAPTR